MDTLTISAIITISCALVFYSIGVWSERISKMLKPIHVVFFWLGLCMDGTGTYLMSIIANSGIRTEKISFHGVVGAIAIMLMIIHAGWASIVLVCKNKDVAKKFHNFSLFVWLIWLIPYFMGMFVGMSMRG